jgi:pyruvate formate lyase activating enzyme
LLAAACNDCSEEGVDGLFHFLEARRGRLEGIVVSGGEPTLQPDLLPFLTTLREMGFRVKLDTNGSRPDVLLNLLSHHAIDYIAMDVKAPLDRYPRLAGVPVDGDVIRESVRLIAESGVDHEFRTTWVESLLRPGDLNSIRQLLPSGSPHKLQPFRPAQALDPALRS